MRETKCSSFSRKQRIVFRGKTKGQKDGQAFRESRCVSRIELNLCIFAGNPIFRHEYYKQLLPLPISFVSFLIRNTVMWRYCDAHKGQLSLASTKARDLLLILYYEMQAEIQLSPFPLLPSLPFISFQSLRNPAFSLAVLLFVDCDQVSATMLPCIRNVINLRA